MGSYLVFERLSCQMDIHWKTAKNVKLKRFQTNSIGPEGKMDPIPFDISAAAMAAWGGKKRCNGTAVDKLTEMKPWSI